MATKLKQRVLKKVHWEMMEILDNGEYSGPLAEDYISDIPRLRRKLRALKLDYEELWAFYNDFLEGSTESNPSGTFGELVFNCI